MKGKEKVAEEEDGQDENQEETEGEAEKEEEAEADREPKEVKPASAKAIDSDLVAKLADNVDLGNSGMTISIYGNTFAQMTECVLV